jgi:hypothetical protein
MGKCFASAKMSTLAISHADCFLVISSVDATFTSSVDATFTSSVDATFTSSVDATFKRMKRSHYSLARASII